MLSWTSAWVAHRTPLNMVAGYAFEVPRVWWIGLIVIRNGEFKIGAWFLCAASAVYIEAFWSYDFNWLDENGAQTTILLYATLVPVVVAALTARSVIIVRRKLAEAERGRWISRAPGASGRSLPRGRPPGER